MRKLCEHVQNYHHESYPAEDESLLSLHNHVEDNSLTTKDDGPLWSKTELQSDEAVSLYEDSLCTLWTFCSFWRKTHSKNSTFGEDGIFCLLFMFPCKQILTFTFLIKLMLCRKRTNTLLGMLSLTWGSYQCTLWHHQGLIYQPWFTWARTSWKVEQSKVEGERTSSHIWGAQTQVIVRGKTVEVFSEWNGKVRVNFLLSLSSSSSS